MSKKKSVISVPDEPQSISLKDLQEFETVSLQRQLAEARLEACDFRVKWRRADAALSELRLKQIADKSILAAEQQAEAATVAYEQSQADFRELGDLLAKRYNFDKSTCAIEPLSGAIVPLQTGS